MTREEILEKINEAVRPLAEEEIADLLHLEQVEELVEMKKLILQMEKNGDIVLTRKGKLGLPSQMGLYVGRISRHIKENNPSAEELKAWHQKSGLPLKRFFNTSGVLYKSMALKDKLPSMTEEEQFELLSTDGMLVKRPIIVADSFVLVGFKEKEWEEALL